MNPFCLPPGNVFLGHIVTLTTGLSITSISFPAGTANPRLIRVSISACAASLIAFTVPLWSTPRPCSLAKSLPRHSTRRRLPARFRDDRRPPIIPPSSLLIYPESKYMTFLKLIKTCIAGVRAFPPDELHNLSLEKLFRPILPRLGDYFRRWDAEAGMEKESRRRPFSWLAVVPA